MSRHAGPLEIMASRDDTASWHRHALPMPVLMTAPAIDDSPARKGKIIALRRPGAVTSSRPSGLALPCQEQDPGLWFSSQPSELNLAKAYCQGCSNRQRCLAGALERAEPTGVWGGEIFQDGRTIEFKRPRGRPRKSASPDGQT
jgi:WhiB family redox-sensing transcriptional regulator